MDDVAERRFSRVVRFPWYDQQWLSAYVATSAYLKASKPEVSVAFEAEMDRLRIDSSFEPVLVEQFFPADVMVQLRAAIAELPANRLERHEILRFGRDVVHGHPLFSWLHKEMVDGVSEIVGEAVEPSYNFLSLYRGLGECALHIDAPNAKWTVDVCIDQSRPWDIHFSPVVPWPTEATTDVDGDWRKPILDAHDFTPHAMLPGQALVFGGSSQWHYRNLMPEATKDDFCTLLFFHFIPAGTRELVRRKRWADRFGLPELDRLLF